MKHLLDVNVLLAAIWGHHAKHAAAYNWLAGKQPVLCPLSELGFIRISSNRRALGIPIDKARQGLATFIQEREADWIADDLPGLDSKAQTSEEVTDYYLADLAAKHGYRLATLDSRIKHPAVDLIA